MSKLLLHHPLADLFPMIGGDELNALIEDVKINNLKIPILTTKVGRQTLIVDGRHRQLACEASGVTPSYQEWDGRGDLLDVICSLNLRHRSLTKTDRAVAAEAAIEHINDADVLDETDKTSAKLQNAVDRKVNIVAAKFGVSPRFVYHVRAIRKSSARIYHAMRLRDLNLSQAINRLDRDRREKDQAKKAELAKLSKGALKIIRGDCIEEMNRLPAACATTIFADPPYNCGWKYDADPTGDDLNPDDYLEWCQRWINAAARLLARNGSLFVLCDDAYADLLSVRMRVSGLHRRNTIIWWETFGVHQTGNFSRCARYLHYYTAQPKGFIFHPEPVDSDRLTKYGDKRANPDGKCPDNVWQIPRLTGNAGERVPFEDMPPQLPVELPKRAILATSEPGDLVVDCFNGNGTTGLAALLTGRKYLGIERSDKYAAQSERWIKAQLSQHQAADRGGK